jgi:hypothetical protein
MGRAAMLACAAPVPRSDARGRSLSIQPPESAMSRTARLIPLHCALLFAGLASLPAWAASTGSGFFRMGDNKQSYSHAVALSRESASEPGKREVKIYLTTHAVDPTQAIGGFDLDQGITDQLREVGGGMTRISVNADGSESGMWFWVSEPSDTFNTSGFGKFTLSANTPTRIEGSHVLSEPEDFFDKTYEFDLKFAIDVTNADFSGDALPAGGGDAGKAWLGYVEAVKKGDLDYLRAQLGEAAEWMLPKDNEESSKSYVEGLRYGLPASATVTGGWLQGDRAILKVDGKDGDGNAQRGVVLMVRDGDRWKEESKDLKTIY